MPKQANVKMLSVGKLRAPTQCIICTLENARHSTFASYKTVELLRVSLKHLIKISAKIDEAFLLDTINNVLHSFFFVIFFSFLYLIITICDLKTFIRSHFSIVCRVIVLESVCYKFILYFFIRQLNAF